MAALPIEQPPSDSAEWSDTEKDETIAWTRVTLGICQARRHTVNATRQPPSVSEQLRAAILAAPVSRYRMAQETGVTEATLSRFVRGERGLDLSSVDKLAAYLGLSLVNMGQHGKGQGGER